VYQPLTSPPQQYHTQKGFCEDLDEGKFSLPLIHLLQNSKRRRMLENLLQERGRKGQMSMDLKKLVLDEMEQTGSLEFTRNTLLDMEADIGGLVERVEGQTGVGNYVLRLMLDRLRIDEA
jgi:ophiobolin F synthase